MTMNFILSVKIFLIVVTHLVWGEVWYECKFTDSVKACKDFENKDVQAEEIKLGMTERSDDEDPGFGLSGPLVVNVPLDDAYSINLNIFKETEIGEEYMFKSSMSLCKSMEDPDTPWAPVFQMMNISSCPINTGNYPIQDLVLSVEPFSSFMSHDFCGEYSVELSLVDDLDPIACFVVGLAILEHEDDDK